MVLVETEARVEEASVEVEVVEEEVLEEQEQEEVVRSDQTIQKVDHILNLGNEDDRNNDRNGSDWSAPKSSGGAWGSSDAPQKPSNTGRWGSNATSE